MTNETILVPPDDTNGTLPPPVNDSLAKKETHSNDLTEKKSAPPLNEVPVSHWIMPPEQHGYIQANEKDCL
jgi:hypothetical protein